jgi:WD40 repeat protein
VGGYHLQLLRDRLAILYNSLELVTYKLSLGGPGGELVSLTWDRTRQLPSKELLAIPEIVRERSSGAFRASTARAAAVSVLGSKKNFGIDMFEPPNDTLRPLNSQMLSFSEEIFVTVGFWDQSFKVHNMDSLKEAFVSFEFPNRATCVAVAQDTIAIGSIRGSVTLWHHETESTLQIFQETLRFAGGGAAPPATSRASIAGAEMSPGDRRSMRSSISGGANNFVSKQAGRKVTPLAVLHCGTDCITAVRCSLELGIVAAGTAAGDVFLHSLDGTFLRKIACCNGGSVSLLESSTIGHIVVHSRTTMSLQVYWVNGQCIAQIEPQERIESIAIGKNGAYCVCGSANGLLSFRSLKNLEEFKVVYELSSYGPIRSIALSPDEDFVWVLSKRRLSLAFWNKEPG